MKPVLLIDDNHDLRVVLQEALEMLGYEVRSAASAQEALAIMAEGYKPEVIICDMIMPQVDGMMFLDQVRALENAQQIGFVAISGTTADRSRVLERGADAFLKKPFSIQSLDKVLAQLQAHE